MTKIDCCRACGAGSLHDVFSLGQTPLANALLTAEALGQQEPTYPLDLVFCPDCSLLQITETVPAETLFSEYVYFSSFSDAMLQHASKLANRLIEQRKLDNHSMVVEVASNDGYLLKNYVAQGIPVLGIEPAGNIAKVANQNGIPTRCEFFGEQCVKGLHSEGVQADVIHAHNVLAHVAELNGVVAGFRKLLKDDGVVVVEFPYVVDMVEQLEFDTIYHEHLCYFSLQAIEQLFRRHDLIVWHVERIPIHGGTLRIFASPTASGVEVDETVRALQATESGLGVGGLDYYSQFSKRIEDLRSSLKQTLSGLRAAGKRIAAYGASAKGSTLLNCFEIDGDTLEYVVDRSTVKQNHYTPGTHLPICSPHKLLTDKPDYVLLLTWNFRDEILQQQHEYRQSGGRFIIPIPRVEIV